VGLQSALSTALTGLNAAETTIDVTGNNIANSNTVGFKESTVNFATQFLQTQSIGSAPTNSRGGTNPRQVGLGVKVAEISPEFTQGTVEISSNPLDIAIEGDGFFIVQGAQGEQLYTRNGQFKTNSDNEVVTITGQRVLGYGVDDNFEIQPTGLTTLQIPLGAAAVAQATENVFLEGVLSPTSDVGTIPGIIQSGILSNGAKEVPTDTAILQSLTRPTDSGVATLGAGAGSVGIGSYSYRFTFIDSEGNEGPVSNATSSLSVSGASSSVDLSAIPQPSSADFTNMRIYRNNSAVDTVYRALSVDQATGTLTINDTESDATIAGNAVLDDTSLDSGSYSYYVTYYKASSGEESRPTAKFGPVTADSTTSPQIRLDKLPEPATLDFDGIRIYRNLSTNQNTFHRVGEISPATIASFPGDISFIDNISDATISSNSQIDLDGPDITFSTLLTDVVSRNGATYTNLFQTDPTTLESTLDFTGKKGGRELAERELTITTTSTIQDLLDFMEDSMGVIQNANESTFPTSSNYGGTISGSRLHFTSNMGIENELDVDLSAFQLTVGSNPASSIPIDFTTVQDANGQGVSADFVVYDSLGIPLNVRVTTVLEEKTATSSSFRWIADSADNEPVSGATTNVGTGVITFDGEGNVISTSNDNIAIDREQSPSSSPLEFQLDFSEISGLASSTNQLNASRQDGFPAGTLSSFIVTENGKIQGVFTNGASRDLGQLRMARFANNSGLEQVGGNMFAAGVNSGLPIQADPGAQGIGSITAGAVELSNTDIGQNLIELITASTQYRGGARVITAVQQLLDELLALRR
jgi:flagellar hook protein FlgE